MGSRDWKALELGVTLNGIRNVLVKRIAGPYRKFSKQLDETQWWSADQLRNLQVQKLREMINHSYESVPFYRNSFKRAGISPDQIKNVGDLAKLPILEKEDVRTHHSELLSERAHNAFVYKCHTSGTTGKPLTLYRDLQNVGFEHAILNRQWRWGGLSEHDLYATLKGDMVVDGNVQAPPFWRLSRVERKLIMSSYHLSEWTADDYIEALFRFQPKGIEGYPSSLYALAKFMEGRGVCFPVRAVFTTSETLYDHYREQIEKVFQCKVFDYYGMAERVAAIHTCEHGRYHVIPEYGITEFVEIENGGGECELVGTSLSNFAMPLIRYRVGDVVKPKPERCTCGRAFPVVEFIVGRKDDYLVTPEGRFIGRLDHIFKGIQNIIESQIVQTKTNEIVIKVVPDRNFSETDGEGIIRKLQRRIGKNMKVRIERVESLARGGRGKFRAVQSRVDADIVGW